MHLSSITIKGFKSFPERTRLEFSPGVSVIVGPNGSGKSNITDAVLWALGEQSPLSVRGQSMQDMIFAGGEGLAPRQSAEVEVVLDNDDGSAGEFSEIAVRRQLDRSGEGEYRLNGARCRMTDVLETLADANLGREMHSVISQGRVEEIVSSKPRQRRLLVEEAAGLGKHRKRRRRAQLKLDRTRENLDRALDVEREARSRLRPLKRQAQAAEIHARLEREGAELRARIVGAELRAHLDVLEQAEARAKAGRGRRDEIEAQLGEVSEQRLAVEQRMAERDRERTQQWGALTELRASHERITVRAEALSSRRGRLQASLERRRSVLGALAEEMRRLEQAQGDDPVGAGLRRVEQALGEARESLERARSADGDAELSEAAAELRDRLERGSRSARQVEELLGRRRQGSLTGDVEALAAAIDALDRLAAAASSVREATGRAVAEAERRVVGERESDEVARELKAHSAREAALQTELRTASEELTAAEVEAQRARDQRDETRGAIARIAEQLGRELDLEAGDELADEERAQIERKLERIARRREQLGPVNPLAEREYEEAQAHVEELAEQRRDMELALAELDELIRKTDRKIHEAFTSTFEATQANFEELVAHLFPGGRGRLRLVTEQGPRPVLAGADADQQGSEQAAGAAEERAEAEAEAEEEERDEFERQGVEIEVTPAGKAMRRLSLLSGGEKSLVAIAFVFAVFLARPSPFYILDEVEAALDDANIDRFLQLVRSFSDRAQFIIVTHQKRTMDAADVLYGVSMGKGGVTQVISRRLPQAAETPTLIEAVEAEEAEAA